MKGLWRLLSRIKEYKRSFILSIISNILLSIFTVISIPLLIPFFSMLFDRVDEIPVKPTEFALNNDWIKYYISTLINTQGRETALLWVCVTLIFVFFCKNIFRYGALYFIAPLRYGIIYDLRKQLYQKFLELPLYARFLLQLVVLPAPEPGAAKALLVTGLDTTLLAGP